jgi:hypothetical protein
MSKFNCYILLTWGPRHGYKTKEHPAAQAQLRNIAAVIRGGFQQSRVVIAASDYTRKIHGPEDLPGLFHYLSTARLREAGTGLVMEDFNRIFRACTPEGKRFVLEALMEYGDLLTDLRTKLRLEQFGRSAISRLVREDMKPLNLARRPHPGSPESRRNQTERARDRSRAARKAHSDKLMRDLLALRDELEGEQGMVTINDLVDHANRAGLRNARGGPLTYPTVARALRRGKGGAPMG